MDRISRGRPGPGAGAWRGARLLVGALILGALVQRLGADPFVEGLRRVSVGSVLAAVALTVVTTWCSAQRWSLVSRRLGVRLPVTRAVAAYYRSQFLNSTLPGGVVGDVHRGYRHGVDAGDLARGLRAVAWERGLGQVVQAALTALVLVAVATPLRGSGLALVALVVVALLLLASTPMLKRRGASWRARLGRAVRDDLDRLRSSTPTLLGIVATSIGAVAGHVAIFLVAARAAGVELGPATMVPVALVVLLAASLPTNVAGWGPREGVAAWAFVAVGLSAAQGVTAAVVYGVATLLATAPGAALLLADLRRPSTRPLIDRDPEEVPAHG